MTTELIGKSDSVTSSQEDSGQVEGEAKPAVAITSAQITADSNTLL